MDSGLNWPHPKYPGVSGNDGFVFPVTGHRTGVGGIHRQYFLAVISPRTENGSPHHLQDMQRPLGSRLSFMSLPQRFHLGEGEDAADRVFDLS